MTRIGVALPAHNAERFIGDALASIAAQQLLPDQIVVVDDGSRDRTAETARQSGLAGLEVIVQQQGGCGAARNTALRRLDCDWVAFIDADDMWHPHKLSCQLGKAMERPEIDIWVGATEGVALGDIPKQPGLIPAEFSSRIHYQMGATLVRKRLFDTVGLFDESLASVEDIDWTMRAIQSGAKMEFHMDTVHIYRRHGANMTNDTRAVETGLLRVLKNSIDRRRSEPK